MDRLKNELFNHLRDSHGNLFPELVAENWYRARQYVLKHIKEWEGNGIGPDTKRYFHIVVEGNDPLMLSIVRHIALIAHYPNFNEDNRATRSVITILYNDASTVADLEAKIAELAKEEYLYNLITYSNYTLFPIKGDPKSNPQALQYLDIDFELRADKKPEDYPPEIRVLSKEKVTDEIKTYKEPLHFKAVDVNKGSLVNLAYSIGTDIDNLPPTDNSSAKRYNIALDCFNRIITPETRLEKWNKPFSDAKDPQKPVDQTALRNMLSCIFSVDTFESRIRGLMQTSEDVGSKKYLLANWNDIRRAISEKLKELSRSEHARWNAEKLIFGFRPMTEEERYKDECSVTNRNSFRKGLKTQTPNPSHIDLMSYADLRRINPQDMKYDCFIILAMPSILRKQNYKPSWWVRLKRSFKSTLME